MSRPPVTLRGVGKRYGAVVALAGVDLEVSPGEVVALVGANGSGKTTLLRVVAGLARPTEGTAAVHGAPVGTREARRGLAYVPDEPSGLDELTVTELVALLRRLSNAGEESGERALVALGLAGRRDVRVGTLSRGLRRRAALTAGLAAEPSVLLLDEATTTLDDGAVERLVRLLRAHADAGRSALVATHDLAFVESACDRVHVLRGGRLVGSGPGAVARPLARLAGGADTTSATEVDGATTAC